MAAAARLLVVSGPSGSGKSSIVRELIERLGIEFSVSATTRLPRPGERHGVHYNFISRRDFEKMIENDELLEWAIYNNRYYGTPQALIEETLADQRDILLEIEIQGARQVRERKPEAIMYFIAPPSLEELEKRLRRRGDTSDEDIEDRLEIAKSEMAEAPDLFDHIIVNDNLDQAISELEGLITTR
ncbi:MAG TPA: guanylate kinase [Acidimicrobiia bacterium]|nr:putative guanylate kinase [Acidimicrobiia bacterium]HYJ23843.1 guanylate kinase [Acidimicrobiia bacterium]